MAKIKAGKRSKSAQSQHIECRNVQTHNLNGFDVDLEIGKWTAITGVSGSGKSSLAFDTIYSESQRRFLETLGTYERQFLAGLPQGDFDTIDPIPPAIALKQNNRTADPRSVIGTTVDVIYPLRLLFAALMDDSCVNCGNAVVSDSSTTMLKALKTKGTAKSADDYVLSVRFEVEKQEKDSKKAFHEKLQLLFNGFLVEGYARIIHEKKVFRTEELKPASFSGGEEIHLVLDIVSGADEEEELRNRCTGLWDQLRNSDRFGTLFVIPIDLDTMKLNFKNQKMFHVSPFCESCSKETQIVKSTDLDWQSALGACESCQGLGNVPLLDEVKVIPNATLSLKKGAIKPYTSDTYKWAQAAMLKMCRAEGIPTDVNYEDLKAKHKDILWKGDPKLVAKHKEFVPLNTFFGWLEEERYKKNSRILLSKYRSYRTCKSCQGARISKRGRRANALETSYDDVFNGEIRQSLKWVEEAGKVIHKGKMKEFIEIHREVQEKIELLCKLGLGSSSLSRRSKTLSGGEYQRALLTRVLGNGLTDSLYVLDEPSIGLGAAEIPSLIECINRLRDQGNTVLMVEHEPDLVMAADTWIELGPGGGNLGGNIVPAETEKPLSLEINLENVNLPKRKKVDANAPFYDSSTAIRLTGFSHLNCENLFVELPSAQFTVISGPSGAGKSTLMGAGIDKALRYGLDMGVFSCESPDTDDNRGMWTSLSLPERMLKTATLVSVEQKAMHRTVTSVPATVLGLFDEIRKLFASDSAAKERGFTASDFSFNGAGGCEECRGRGFVKDDLFFLGEVEKVCEVCSGSRYRPEVLEVKFKGRSIADWLSMSLAECLYEGLIPNRREVLKMCCDLGLGQLPFGIPTTQVSGGESQRLRIAAALTKTKGKLICLLDEPSRGLSEKDIGKLISTLQSLCFAGHTIVVVEHHEAFQDACDQLLQMGPGSGTEGGQIAGRSVVLANAAAQGADKRKKKK